MFSQPPRTDSDGPGRLPERTYLGAAQVDQLCGLVFELAGQVHELRVRVARLEAGTAETETDTTDTDTTEPGTATRLDAELRASIDGLLAVLLEADDARQPLRRHSRLTTHGATTTGGEPT
jgi:hypothetical protein